MKKIKNNKLNLYFFVLFPLLLNSILLFYVQNDLWDGVSISYASKIKNLDSIKFWFFQSGWQLQYYQILLFNNLSNFFSINYILMNKLIILLFFILLIFHISEIKLFKINYDKIHIKSLLVFFIFLSPVFSTLTSSVMTFHFVSFVLCLFAVHYLRKNNLFYNFIGFFSLIISLFYPGNLGFVIGYNYYLDCINNEPIKLNKYLKISTPSLKSIIISIFTILFYLTHKSFLSPYGFWENYYSVKSFYEINNIILFLSGMIKYSTLYLPIILFFFIFIIIYSFSLIQIKKTFYKNFNILFGLFIFNLFSLLPYVLVGVSTSIFDVFDWNSRNMLPLVIPIGVLNCYSIFFFKKIYRFKNNLNLKFYIFCIPLICYLFLGSLGWYDKINRDNYYNKIINFIGKNSLFFEDSYVHLKTHQYPFIRSYEYNYLYFLATAKTNSFIFEKKTSYNIATKQQNSQLSKLAKEDFGFEKKDIEQYLNLTNIEKIKFLKNKHPKLFLIYKNFLLSDIENLNNYKIKEIFFLKNYGNDPKNLLKNYLKKYLNKAKSN